MKKITGKKGFSLVECLIAIAVFAIMSAIVMLLLSMTTTQTASNNRTASDIGVQLNAIVQDDEVHSVLLTEAEGGKSNAQKAADILKFNVRDKNGTETVDGMRISFDYVEYYVCQSCGATISARELEDSGNICSGCGATVDVSGSSLLISGLIANGLRYGTLDLTTDKASMPNYVDRISFLVTSVAVANETIYTISGISLGGSLSSSVGDTVNIVLPDLVGTDYSYKIGNVSVETFGTSTEVTTTRGDKSIISIKDKGTTDEPPAATNFSGIGSLSISFTLKNSESNTDFEADYEVEGGLTQAWFGTSGNSVTINNPALTP